MICYLRIHHRPKCDINGLSGTTVQDNCTSREQSVIWRTGQPFSAQNVSISMSLISYIDTKIMPLCWVCHLSHSFQQEAGALIPRTRPIQCTDALKPKLGSQKDTEPATSPYKRYSMCWDAQGSDEHAVSVIPGPIQLFNLLANLRV